MNTAAPDARPPVRVLIIPGLNGSGEAHWQSWLQPQCPNARRVDQAEPDRPVLVTWSARIAEVLAEEPAGDWVAVAHSFGCLALAHHLGHRLEHRLANGSASDSTHRGAMPSRIAAALLVAPAEPVRFELEHALPTAALGVPGRMLGSDTDPWMSPDSARAWADRWSLAFTSLGDVGHINPDSGFGPLPIALELTERLIRQVERDRQRDHHKDPVDL